MPERIKLTEKVLREAEPVPGRDYQIFDTDVRGFAACIYRGGGRAFTLDYRHAGRQRRMTFGRLWRLSPLGVIGIFLMGGVFSALFGMASVWGSR